MIQWRTQVGNTTTNLKVKVDYTLTPLSANNVVNLDWHVDDSSKGRYDMILGRDLLTQLKLNSKSIEHVIEAHDGPFQGSTTRMIDLGRYTFKYLNTEKITPE